MDPISGAGPIKQTAVLLFYGWGYNFYRAENQLRADDLLIRSKVCGILSEARAVLAHLEREYRRLWLPPPTRDAPFPDRARFEQARLLERCGVAIERIATAIQSAPTPANDFVWLRHRGERGMLEVLQGIDARLVDEAVAFHDRIVVLDLAPVSEPGFEAEVLEWLKPLRATIQERNERLTLMV